MCFKWLVSPDARVRLQLLKDCLRGHIQNVVDNVDDTVLGNDIRRDDGSVHTRALYRYNRQTVWHFGHCEVQHAICAHGRGAKHLQSRKEQNKSVY